MASVMAQSQTHTSLGGFDDSMEISSDAGRQGEGDIDIDIDVPPEDGRAANDDDMLDDNATEVQDDDVMFDEDGAADNDEEHMEEDLLDYEDEELADVEIGLRGETEFLPNNQSYFEDGLQESLGAGSLNQSLEVENAHEVHPHEPQSNQLQPDEVSIRQTSNGEDFEDHLEAEEGSSEPSKVNEGAESSHNEVDYKDEQSLAATNLDLPEQTPTTFLERSASQIDHLTDQTEISAEQLTTESNDYFIDTEQIAQSTEAVEQSSVNPIVSLNNSDDAADVYTSVLEEESKETLDNNEDSQVHGGDEDPETATASATFSHPHPVVVLWEEEEIPMFPLDDRSEFFLDDASIVTSHFSELFAAFKQVLGEADSDRLDLCIGFDDLDLIIDESGSQTFLPTLADVINLYLELHQNDGNNVPPPLRLSLTSRENPGARFESLRHIAAEGKGISLISVANTDDNFNDNTDEHEVEQVYPDDATAHTEHLSPSRATDVYNEQPSSAVDNNHTTAAERGGEIPFESKVEAKEHENRSPPNHTESVRDAESDHAAEKEGDRNEETIFEEEEYYEEDLLDDDHDEYYEPETNQEAPNGSTSSSTIQGDDDEVQAAESSSQLQANKSAQQPQEEIQDELGALDHGQVEPWDPQADAEGGTALGPLAEAAEHSPSEEADRHSNIGTGGHTNTNIDLQASNQGSDHSVSEDKPDYTYATESEEVPKASLRIDDESRYHQEPDVVESPAESRDNLDEGSEAEEEHQNFYLLDESAEDNAQVDPANGEFLDLGESDAIHESPKDFGELGQSGGAHPELISEDPSSVADGTPKLGRKRSWSEQDNGQDEIEQGNDAKKARPS